MICLLYIEIIIKELSIVCSDTVPLIARAVIRIMHNVFNASCRVLAYGGCARSTRPVCQTKAELDSLSLKTTR